MTCPRALLIAGEAMAVGIAWPWYAVCPGETIDLAMQSCTRPSISSLATDAFIIYTDREGALRVQCVYPVGRLGSRLVYGKTSSVGICEGGKGCEKVRSCAGAIETRESLYPSCIPSYPLLAPERVLNATHSVHNLCPGTPRPHGIAT